MRRRGWNKYSAKRTVVDGITFASKREAKRYNELKLMQKAGYIEDLELQPRYKLEVNGVLIGHYKADFKYWQWNNVSGRIRTARDALAGREIVEDVKGAKSRDYPLRKKLMAALYGIEIQEIR